MELRRSHPGTLRKFFHEQNCRNEKLIEERIAAIYQAMPATEDQAIVEGESRMARALVEVIAALRRNIADYDKRIEQVVAEHPEGSLFSSLPGAGPVLVPRLMVAFGTLRERFKSAAEVQCLSGIAPVTERSGQTEWVHARQACPRFLRQTFHEFAARSIQKSGWAKAFYERQKEKNKSHHTAVRALAFRWIRIIYRCWKDRQPYDEQSYMKSLQQRGSPLLGSFLLTTGGEWKMVAGFKKFSPKSS